MTPSGGRAATAGGARGTAGPQESPGMRWGAQGGLAALLSYPRSWSRDRSADRSPGCSTAGPFPSLPLRVRLQPGELQEAASATAGLTAGAAASGNGRRRFRNLREFSGRAGAEAMGRGGGRAGGGAAAGPRGPAPAAGGGARRARAVPAEGTPYRQEVKASAVVSFCLQISSRLIGCGCLAQRILATPPPSIPLLWEQQCRFVCVLVA